MVPAAIVELDQLPLTRNGKLDRSRLPAPAFDQQQETFVAPRTPTEENLARIWSEVLNVERLGVNDNFFDLGGHCCARLRSFRGCRTYSASSCRCVCCSIPTVAELAEEVDTYGVQNVCATAG